MFEWLRHKTTCTTTSHHHGSGALLTTAAGSRCAASETKKICVRVLSGVQDVCETAVAAETEGHSRKQHSETKQESTMKHSMEQAQMRQNVKTYRSRCSKHTPF